MASHVNKSVVKLFFRNVMLLSPFLEHFARPEVRVLLDKGVVLFRLSTI